MRRLIVVGLLLDPLAAVAASLTPYQVYPAAPWPTGWPEAVAVGDVNGDGREDVVLATTATQQGQNPDDYTLFIFLQNTSGGLNAPIKVKYSSESEEGNHSIGFRRWTGIVIADFDGDGIDDVVAGRRFGISVLPGSRTAQFSVKRVECVSGACGADSMAVMDVDRDGAMDIVAHNELGERFGITVYFGDRGSFTRQRLLTTRSDGGVNVRAVDVDGDGHDDLVISWMQGLSNGAEVFLADRRGWFRPGTYVPRDSDLIYVRALAVADFNGDYRKDIVLGGSSFAFDGRGIYLHARKKVEDGFEAPVQLPAATPSDSADIPDRSVSVDINGDGKDDLLLLRSGGDIGYFEQGLTGLKPEVIFEGPYMTWGNPHAIATGDVNGDGCTDVVTANSNYGLVVFRTRDCMVRNRVNGSQPLIRAGQIGPPPNTAESGAVATPDSVTEASAPTGTIASEQRSSDRAVRSPAWAYFMLCIAVFLGVFRRWW